MSEHSEQSEAEIVDDQSLTAIGHLAVENDPDLMRHVGPNGIPVDGYGRKIYSTEQPRPVAQSARGVTIRRFSGVILPAPPEWVRPGAKPVRKPIDWAG